MERESYHKDDMSVSSVEDHINSSMYTTPHNIPNKNPRHSILRWAQNLFLCLRPPFRRRRPRQQYHSPPQRPTAPLSPPQAVTIYYHPVIPPGFNGTGTRPTIAPHAPVIPGAWQNGYYHSPPPAYHHHSPAPMFTQWDEHNQGRTLSQTQGPPYTAYNPQAYNHTHVAQNGLFVPPTQRHPVPPPGAYNTYATPHPNPVAHHHMTPAAYPPFPGSSWTQAMLDPEPIRSAPYTNPTSAIAPRQMVGTPYATHPLPRPHTQQQGYHYPLPPQRSVHPVARSIAPTPYTHQLPAPHAQHPASNPTPSQSYPLPPLPRAISPVDRSVSPDDLPPHPSWLGPNGELPPRGGTPPRYRRNTPRRASTPPRQLTPSPSPSPAPAPRRSGTPRATPTAQPHPATTAQQHPATTPRQHPALMPHAAHTPRPTPTPARSATPISQLALLQPPMLLGPPQSILSEISIPSAPGHRGIGKFEVEVPAADTEQGTASELYRGRTPSRGRKRSRARKTKVEGEGVL